MGFGSGSEPLHLPAPPPQAAPATLADPAVGAVGQNAKSRAAAAAMAQGSGTPGDLTQPNTAKTTLLS